MLEHSLKSIITHCREKSKFHLKESIDPKLIERVEGAWHNEGRGRGGYSEDTNCGDCSSWLRGGVRDCGWWRPCPSIRRNLTIVFSGSEIWGQLGDLLQVFLANYFLNLILFSFRQGNSLPLFILLPWKGVTRVVEAVNSTWIQPSQESQLKNQLISSCDSPYWTISLHNLFPSF